MFDCKLIITLIALVGAAMVICNNTKKAGQENFSFDLLWKKEQKVVPKTCFTNTQGGSDIKYNMTVPCEPMTFGKMVKENFMATADSSTKACKCSDDCGDCGCKEKSQYPEVTDMMPIGDMTNVNALKDTHQVGYDRQVYAKRSSRIRALGDPIRGDMFIPRSTNHTGWFQTSATYNDLHPGAMAVLVGENNGNNC